MTARRKLAFACVAVALGLAALELASRVVELASPPAAIDYDLGFGPESRVYAPAADDPAWRETAPAKRAFFLTQRFRAEKPTRAIRIAVVGGSSVRYADDELRALARGVGDALGASGTVELVNAGGLGYGSHRLVPIAAELLGYDLDLLLVYSGHNEFEEVEQLALARSPATPIERVLAEHSALVRTIRRLVTRLRVDALQRAHDRKLLSKAPAQARAWNHPFTRADVDARMAAYERNLRRIVELAGRAGVPVVLGTVPSNLLRPILPPGARDDFGPIRALYLDGAWDEARARAAAFLADTPGRHQASATENAIVRRVALETNTPLADVEARVLAAEPHGVPGETLFRDHCHLNARGNRILREAYEPIAIELLR